MQGHPERVSAAVRHGYDLPQRLSHQRHLKKTKKYDACPALRFALNCFLSITNNHACPISATLAIKWMCQTSNFFLKQKLSQTLNIHYILYYVHYIHCTLELKLTFQKSHFFTFSGFPISNYVFLLYSKLTSFLIKQCWEDVYL